MIKNYNICFVCNHGKTLTFSSIANGLKKNHKVSWISTNSNNIKKYQLDNCLNIGRNNIKKNMNTNHL